VVLPKTKSPWIQDIKIKALELIDKEFEGYSPPTVFVGSKYINLKKANVGVLSPIGNKEEAWKYDDPHYWYTSEYTLQQIVELRSQLINARKKAGIFDVRTNNKFLELAQEIAMSRKTTGVEVELKKRLHPLLHLDSLHLPFGPGGEIHKIKAMNTIKLEPQVEKVFYDTDLKAVDGIRFLKDKGLNEYQLSQLLSIGVMGVKTNRKLVPTKWSITATDDTLGKDLIKEIKTFPIIQDYRFLFGNYFGNYYLILLFPEVWSYELFESSLPDTWPSPDFELYTTTDYESYLGRKNYADHTVGGYYAARLSLLEYLKERKIQASTLLLRFVTSEYSTPLGVFVVRQAVRKTVSTPELSFTDKKIMLDYCKSLIIRKFNYDINNLLKKSILLTKINTQKKLFEF